MRYIIIFLTVIVLFSEKKVKSKPYQQPSICDRISTSGRSLLTAQRHCSPKNLARATAARAPSAARAPRPPCPRLRPRLRRSPRRRRPRHRLPLLLPPSPATLAQTTAPFSRSVIAPSTYGAPQRTCSRTFGRQSSDLLIDRSEARNNNQPLLETHSTL